MSKRPLLDRVIEGLASTAATELTERLGTGMTEKGKANVRRHLRRELRDSMKGGVKKVASAAKKVKEKVTQPAKPKVNLELMQFNTACAVLGLGNQMHGKPVAADKIHEAKRAAARLFHPDANNGSEKKREQLQAVLDAADWLEKYNTRVEGAK